MHRRMTIAGAFLMAVSSLASAEMTVVDKLALGPEGPLYDNGNLYYVEWGSSELTRWDGESISTVHQEDGCGHNGLALTSQDTFLVACFFSSEVLELDRDGKELRRWSADSTGQAFVSPNDFSVAADGGIYMTVFGPWEAVPRSIIGTVVYLAPGSHEWVLVADDLNYPNGLALTPDGKTLYVAETVGNRLLRFAVNDDGTLGQRENFVFLGLLEDNVTNMWVGPDGIKVDSAGNVYITQYTGGGYLFKVDPEGKLLHRFELSGDGVTNLAFGATEDELYVTYVIDLMDPWSGKVVKIANVH